MARKASQQSQALRSEIRNVMKRAKDDLRKRQEEALENIDEKIKQESLILSAEKEEMKGKDEGDGAHILL